MGGGIKSALCCFRILELKPQAVFFPETKMVKNVQEPRGNCWSFGNSWVEEGLLSKPRQRSGAEFRDICVLG